ncbi:MAG: glycosyltransferase family 4 protein [Calothrix sp. MO_192.B10]|nr:glycosyltransferase family 4 protein [Calothrix sp. MO_192.B10]
MTISEVIQDSFHPNSKTLEFINQELIRANQAIKLTVVTQFFPPDYAATGQLIEELVRHLGKQGVDVQVFTGQPGYAFQSQDAPCKENIGRVKVRRTRTTQLWSNRIRAKALNGIIFLLRATLHIIFSCRNRNVLLLTTAPPFLPLLGYIAHLLFGVSYVCLVYDLYPDIAIDLGVISQSHWIARLWQGLNRRIWRKSKGIVVLSPAMKERIIKICPQVAHKISVIHSWADPKKIVPISKHKNWFAREHNLIDKFTVLYSGNMGRCHDIDTILEAATYLKDEPIQFLCIGGGAKRKQLIQKVNLLGLDKNFLFLPYQDKDVLPYSLTACDVSLVSVDAGMESLVAPSKLYGALAAGRPLAVICPHHSYLKQLVATAKCGDSVENGDGYGLAQFILSLNSDRQLAERMGKAGREYLQSNFTPQVIAKQYAQVLQQAIS